MNIKYCYISKLIFSLIFNILNQNSILKIAIELKMKKNLHSLITNDY